MTQDRRKMTSAAGCALLLAGVLLYAALSGGQAAPGTGVGIPAPVIDVARSHSEQQYPAFHGPTGLPLDDVTWRVVRGTGNCCENYLTVTSAGRLVDIGGSYPTFSDDEGMTWRQARPLTPLLNGEGAAVTAPNGDILIIEWDPYSGDHTLAFKYDAAEETWHYQEVPVHTPFYDRPWISVVPGPLTVAGQTIPYVVIAKGGWPYKDVLLLSFDGLNYFVPSNTLPSSLQSRTTTTILEPAAPWADWIQPHTESRLTPLPSGSTLAKGGSSWFVMDDVLDWDRIDTPGGLGGGRILVASDGALHRVTSVPYTFDYAVSVDGGVSWSNTTLHLPAEHRAEDFDFKVNAALGFAAVAVHAHNKVTGTDQDLVFKVDVTGPAPFLDTLYFVGDGDLNAGSGLGGTSRFDFTTIAILPSGKIAVSMIDKEQRRPSVAIMV